ncbi:hypothetical protein PF002_g1826 [Phytophthora fragariae]|uniref:Uncharacterized protein n=1 Tax=Phytophthora fragariae TaxID=53985 RepID=A0A6A4AFL6_9STRA|nr:hypothetical protein PF002_g1826 [Phytophthora fragariae]
MSHDIAEELHVFTGDLLDCRDKDRQARVGGGALSSLLKRSRGILVLLITAWGMTWTFHSSTRYVCTHVRSKCGPLGRGVHDMFLVAAMLNVLLDVWDAEIATCVTGITVSMSMAPHSIAKPACASWSRGFFMRRRISCFQWNRHPLMATFGSWCRMAAIKAAS